VRILGVPTVADRIAQTVARLYFEPEVEPLFHPDSYGYRPKRSALDAVAACRERCWKYDWVIDLDIRSFFDSFGSRPCPTSGVEAHGPPLGPPLCGAVAESTASTGGRPRWWRGSVDPAGFCDLAVLANLFLHYAFDTWLAREFPAARFERYADDAVVHCTSEAQARTVLAAIADRMSEVGLELHPDKTRIVYCKDSNRKGSFGHERFTFLGYTFRPRLAKNKHGEPFVSFSPAVSDDAAKRIRWHIRRWRLNLRTHQSLKELAEESNPILRGWINYYGHFYKSGLYPSLRRINEYLVRWAMRKYKRLHGRPTRAWRFLANVWRRDPNLFAHWRLGVHPMVG